MVLGPAVLALLFSSLVICAITAVAAWAGATLAAGWRPDRHDERQLSRERRVLLVESSLKVVLGCQLSSLFLFVATVDRLHPLITGAMCAAGALHASRFGYPALLVKLTVFLLCGLWLIVNRATIRSGATAVVRAKHGMLLAVLAALVTENVLQWRYFLDLDPGVITSCCATIFDPGAAGLGAGLASMPVEISRSVFFAGLVLTLGAGARVLLRRGTAGAFSILASCLGVAAFSALVSWVAPAFYALPTHHCPFCLLSARAGHVGYVLFAALGLAIVTGIGAGVVDRLRAFDPTRSIRAGEEHRLCAVSMAGFALFALVAVLPMLGSGLHLKGG